jgi:phage-related tail fiber protein
MPGLGVRNFTTEVLTSANVNGYLMQQSVMVFADPATRTAQLAAQSITPSAGMVSYITSIGEIQLYNGATWDSVSVTAPGAVMYFARNTAPTGWLKANGASLSRTTYASLFAGIGTTYGTVDANTFSLPDLRGEFVRGWDDSRGVDASRGFGSFQDQDWKGFYQTNTGQNTGSYNHNNVYMGKTIYGSYTGNLFTGDWAAPAAAMGTAWDGSEIRPRNRALLACIKF